MVQSRSQGQSMRGALGTLAQELVVQSRSHGQSTRGAPGTPALSEERLLSARRAVLITLRHARV